MIRTYASEGDALRPLEPGATEPPVWIDLHRPDAAEIAAAAAALGAELPTLDEMEEIETSSRLYLENGVAFLTAILPEGADTGDPRLAPATFALGANVLVTLRHHEPKPFETFPLRSQQAPLACSSPEGVLVGLLDAVTDRLADVLEGAKREIDALSREVFRRSERPQDKTNSFQRTLEQIGREGELLSRIRECVSSMERLVAFLNAVVGQRKCSREVRGAVKTLARDVRSLVEYIEFMSQKITLLLDATLGMINIEQSGIIKIFSVAAVVFLPPTLIASIYGMNFEAMPELAWRLGYPFALGLMILAAALPYFYFKRRGWL